MQRGRTDDDFNDEVRSHIALETDRLIAEGLSPEDARLAAIRMFGNIAATQERFYESRRVLWFEQTLQDLRYAGRMLRKNPTFAAIAILTLALGIGVNAAIFSVIKLVLIEPLPYPDSDRLVQIVQTVPGSMTVDGRPNRTASIQQQEFSELRSRAQTLAQFAAYDSHSEVTLSGRGTPIRLIGTPVSASLFPMLEVQPFLGRPFTEAEENRNAPQSVILSYTAWQKYFGMDPNLLTSMLVLNGRAYSVAGIMPRGFAFPDSVTEFWLPLDLTPLPPGDTRDFTPVARLRDRIAIGAAAEEVNAIVGQLRRTYPSNKVVWPASFEILSIKDELVRPVRPALVVMMIAVTFVLLIACSNVANLLLARGAARQGERAMRAALGAGRGRLIRQALAESFLLGLLGGTLGLVVAGAGVFFLRNLAAGYMPRLDRIGMDLGVLAFTLALSLVASLFFGLIPAFQWTSEPHMAVIKSKAGAKGSLRHRAGKLIVIAETGLAVVLLIGGSLLIRSFIKLSNVNPGFDPTNVLTFQIALPQPLNPTILTDSSTEEFQSRIQSMPGVRSVAFSSALPLIVRNSYTQPRIGGTPLPIEGEPQYREVSRNYLVAMGLRLIAGRAFDAEDVSGRPRAAIINQAMARYFGGENPIGRTLTLARSTAEIVGIVNDIHDQGLNVEPRPQIYVDSRQSLGLSRNAQALNWAYFIVRGDRSPESMIPDIRSMVGQMIPGATLKLNAAAMEQVISGTIGRPRLNAVLLGIFGVVAVLLAMIGVYGVTAYSAAQRMREFGIRIALGATPLNVLAVALRQALVLAGTGIALGIGGAVLVTRYMEDLLFGLTPQDPITFVAVSVAFAFISLFAAYLPARRATQIDPLIALRLE